LLFTSVTYVLALPAHLYMHQFFTLCLPDHHPLSYIDVYYACTIKQLCYADLVYILFFAYYRFFKDPIRVPRIQNRVPRIRENYHRVLAIREIGSLNIHIGYLTFSLKKTWPITTFSLFINSNTKNYNHNGLFAMVLF